MFKKISLEQLYVANYVMESLEYVYSGLFKPVSIIHHFNIKKEKDIFILVTNAKNNFVGYMSLTDGQIYQQLNMNLQDYEVTVDIENKEALKQAEKVNSGFINFEPLKNYDSKFIKSYMSIRETKKAIKEVNSRIQDEQPKTKHFVAYRINA